MTLQDTDKFLVNRSGSSYNVDAQDLMAIEDADLMLVNRNGQSYKVTGAEVKSSLTPALTGEATVTPVDIKTGGTLTCTAFASGGISPYTFSYEWYYKFGTIFGWTPFPSADSPTLVIPDEQVGRTFRCKVTITDNAGTTEEVTSNETLPVEAGTRPPVIDSVTLVENNPNADPRFTNQQFTATATLSDDGEPASVKAFDAYVVGALTTLGKFEEPLESYSSSGTSYETGWTFSSTGSTTTPDVQGTPAGIFTQGQSYAFQVSGTGKTCVMQANIPASTEFVEGPCYVGFQVFSNSRYFQGNVRPIITTSLGNPNKVNEIVSSQANYYIEVPDGQRLSWVKVSTGPSSGLGSSQAGLAAFWRFDTPPIVQDFDLSAALLNIPMRTDLVFAAGTDMSTLADGDEVTQPSEIAARAWSDDVTEQGGSGPNNPSNMFDGDLNTYAQSFNYNGNIFWDTSAYPLTGKLKVYVGLTASSPTYTVLYTDKNNNNRSRSFPGDSGFFELAVEELTSFQVKYGPYQNYTQIKGIELDGALIINNQPIAGEITGTVDSIADTTVTLTERVDGWENGSNVTGPEKEITGDNIKMYLEFDSNGTVTDLIPQPQSPVYAVSGINPSLTLTFPATFPSGKTPDDEIGAGSRLTVEAGAANSAGSTSYVGATVQPTGDPPSFQFREPLASTGGGSSGEIAARKWSNTLSGDGGFSNNGAANAFDGDPLTFAGTNTTNGNITWNTSTFPLTGRLGVIAESSTKGTSFVRVTHSGGTTTVNGGALNPDIGNRFLYEFPELTGITQVYISQNDPNYGVGAVTAFYLDGSIIINDQPIIPSTVLNFNPLADMSNLAAGDEVNQNGTTGTVESINGTSVELTERVDGWVVGDDVVGPDKTPFRSMTEEELAEQKLKFLTYQNRKEVVCGERAEAERDALIQQMADEGYSLEDILEYL